MRNSRRWYVLTLKIDAWKEIVSLPERTQVEEKALQPKAHATNGSVTVSVREHPALLLMTLPHQGGLTRRNEANQKVVVRAETNLPVGTPRKLERGPRSEGNLLPVSWTNLHVANTYRENAISRLELVGIGILHLVFTSRRENARKERIVTSFTQGAQHST